METKLEQAYLYDFYGELLNERQRRVYEDFYFNDLSLSEIASDEGISRQGVHDLIKRCSRALEEYENKLHLVEKFLYIKEKVGVIQQLTSSYDEKNQESIRTEISKISNEILEEL
ncbi:MAG: DNA-binding protein [Lachnospiraceae bacterium]|nr:DNA-binding protein [Lachnospiraceae bacterium]